MWVWATWQGEGCLSFPNPGWDAGAQWQSGCTGEACKGDGGTVQGCRNRSCEKVSQLIYSQMTSCLVHTPPSPPLASELRDHSAIPLLDIYPKEMKSVCSKGIYIPLFIAAVFIIVKSTSINGEKKCIHTHNGILFSLKKEGNPVICNNMAKVLCEVK